MRRIAAIAIAALLVTACSDRAKPPPQASGEWFQINPARWAAAGPVTGSVAGLRR